MPRLAVSQGRRFIFAGGVYISLTGKWALLISIWHLTRSCLPPLLSLSYPSICFMNLFIHVSIRLLFSVFLTPSVCSSIRLLLSNHFIKFSLIFIHHSLSIILFPYLFVYPSVNRLICLSSYIYSSIHPSECVSISRSI